MRQRIVGIALGYEDLNDHDRLRLDSLLALLCGKSDLSGEKRKRSRDQGVPLAGASTLNRMELGKAEQAPSDRYRKIVADPAKMDRLLVDLFMESYDSAPEEIWLDLDATDDPVHGQQEFRFYHGYYDAYCYLPLYIFCGEHLLCARLHPAKIDAPAGADEELCRIVAQIREKWPDTRIVIRADSGFCRDWLLDWCEQNEVYYLVGVSKNARLHKRISKALSKSRNRCHQSAEASRRYVQFQYRTVNSWSRSRQVIAKAECLADPRSHKIGAVKDNPRFVVTNLARSMTGSIQSIYEDQYCARAECENRIKEQQLCLFADRTSSHQMSANQLRLYFSSFAYLLMQSLRRMALKGTVHEKAQCSTIRVKFFKIAATLQVTARRVWLSMPDNYPWQKVFETALNNLSIQQVRAPPGTA